MIGVWQRFGQGQPPQDGGALVYLRPYGGDILDVLEGRHGEAIACVHRYGMLHEFSGSSYGIPVGMLWTSLPPPDAQA